MANHPISSFTSAMNPRNSGCKRNMEGIDVQRIDKNLYQQAEAIEFMYVSAELHRSSLVNIRTEMTSCNMPRSLLVYSV